MSAVREGFMQKVAGSMMHKGTEFYQAEMERSGAEGVTF